MNKQRRSEVRQLLILSGYNAIEVSNLTDEECEVEWDKLCDSSPTV